MIVPDLLVFSIETLENNGEFKGSAYVGVCGPGREDKGTAETPTIQQLDLTPCLDVIIPSVGRSIEAELILVDGNPIVKTAPLSRVQQALVTDRHTVRQGPDVYVKILNMLNRRTTLDNLLLQEMLRIVMCSTFGFNLLSPTLKK